MFPRRVLPLLLLATVAAAEAGAQSPAPPARPRAGAAVLLRRVALAAGGALLGAGLGYFASQVAHSDWDRSPDADFSRLRRNYALAGGAAGATLGAFLVPAVSSPAPGVRDGRGVPIIGARQIAALEASAPSAFDVVQRLHPEWLVERQTRTLAEQGHVVSADDRGNVVAAPGVPTIQVYLDLANLGGVDALRQVPAASLHSIEHLDAAQATYRFGGGHTRPVILLTSVGGPEEEPR